MTESRPQHPGLFFGGLGAPGCKVGKTPGRFVRNVVAEITAYGWSTIQPPKTLWTDRVGATRMPFMRTNKTRHTSIGDYIAAPKGAQSKLREIRAGIRKAAPGATEGMKWSMPCFSYRRILVMFALQ